MVRSNPEAEYRAMSLGICEKIWLQKVLSDLHHKCETPLKLFCDNNATISIVNNPIQHDRTKHVEFDRHIIICILYIPSSQQVTDILTKELLIPNFDFCVTKLGLIDIYVPTWEECQILYLWKKYLWKTYHKFFFSFFSLPFAFYLNFSIVLM